MADDEIVIVGSGPSGAIAAWTLVNAGCKVVLLESGNSFPKGFHLRWKDQEIKRRFHPLQVWGHTLPPDYENLGDPFTRWVKAHMLGGLGNFWGGVVLRFAPEDFTQGEAVSEKFRWPITYDDLEPYYKRVEQLIGVRGTGQSVSALPACEITHHRQFPHELSDLAKAARQLDRWLLPMNDVYGKSTIISQIPSPFNLSLRLMQQLRHRSNFRLIQNAHVTRVLLKRQNALASGVEYINRETGKLHFQSAKAVMLAAGQLGSTHILLNSCATDSFGEVGNSNGLLGRYLHDNPMAVFSYKIDRPSPQLDPWLMGGLYLTRVDYTKAEPLQANGFQVYAGTSNHQPVNLRNNFRFNTQQLEDGYLIFACFGTQVPDESRYVCLHPTAKDEYGLPLLRINTHHNQSDLDILDKGGYASQSLLEIAGWRSVLESVSIEPPGTSVHFGGTARMHSDPKLGVLNAYNQMHEIPNVFVIDASCFPTSVEKNPTLTLMAIAMRAAHHLRTLVKIS